MVSSFSRLRRHSDALIYLHDWRVMRYSSAKYLKVRNITRQHFHNDLRVHKVIASVVAFELHAL